MLAWRYVTRIDMAFRHHVYSLVVYSHPAFLAALIFYSCLDIDQRSWAQHGIWNECLSIIRPKMLWHIQYSNMHHLIYFRKTAHTKSVPIAGHVSYLIHNHQVRNSLYMAVNITVSTIIIPMHNGLGIKPHDNKAQIMDKTCTFYVLMSESGICQACQDAV